MKVIELYPNYSVTEDGRVFNNNRKCFISGYRSKKGYRFVTLKGADGKMRNLTIHRLVAQAYIPNPLCKAEVNHINGIKGDDRVENLEWVTHSENALHSFKLGLSTQSEEKRKMLSEKYKGEGNSSAKLTDEQVLQIREMYSTGKYSCAKLGKMFSMSPQAINSIIRKITWKHL